MMMINSTQLASFFTKFTKETQPGAQTLVLPQT